MKTPHSLPLTPHPIFTPLELLNLYYSDGQSLGNRENKLWQKMNSLLSWDNILNKGYQSDLCPLLFCIPANWELGFKVNRWVLETGKLALSGFNGQSTFP